MRHKITEKCIREHWDDYFQYKSYDDSMEFPPKHYSTDFLREWKDVFKSHQWKDMSYTRNLLTEPQLIEFEKYINWAGIAQCYKLSEQFLHKYRYKLPWWYK